MKRINPIFFFFLILFSCGKEKNPSLRTIVATSQAGFTDSSEKLNSLHALELQVPMSNDQLKKWIPEKVGQMELRKLIVGHKQGVEMSGAIATYTTQDEESKQISLEVLDGAGATGSVMLKAIGQKLELDYQEEMSSGHSRIYERAGIRVWEKVNTKDHLSEIELVLQERYHLIFKGHQIGMEELWDFVNEVKKEMN